ncbi:MAG: hypothetical protein AAB902_00260, partial [Patescibacteria group bacterium]
MSKRNLILLIIILIIVIIAVFGFLYFRQGTTAPGEKSQGTNFISRFNPFGNTSKPTPPTATPPVDISGYQPGPGEEIQKIKLKKVSSMPIAGFTIFTKERLKNVPIVAQTDTTTTPSTDSGSSTAPATTSTTKKTSTKPTPPLTEFALALRYVDKASGNIYQTFADKIEERKFSTTVIPKIYEAYFGNKGGSVVMRYLKTDGKTIETFVGNLPKEYLGADTTVTNEVKGSFLPEDIKDISLSPDAGSVFYLFNVGDNMVGTTLNLLNNKKVQIFVSPFTEWLSLWPNSKMITFTTKPSSGLPGYMYAMDPNNKNLNKIFGNINGLTTLASPNGKLVLYGNDNLSLNVYHLDTKVADPLGVKTLPEKCAWGKMSDVVYCAVPKSINVGQYPDVWYQGEISFSDQLWKIDIKSGNATMVLDP